MGAFLELLSFFVRGGHYGPQRQDRVKLKILQEQWVVAIIIIAKNSLLLKHNSEIIWSIILIKRVSKTRKLNWDIVWIMVREKNYKYQNI